MGLSPPTVAVALAAVLSVVACADGGATAPTAAVSPSPDATTPQPTGAPAVTSPSPTVSPGTGPTGTPQAACSAAGMDTSGFTENPDLTGPANQTRRDIAAAAVACDYQRLAALGADDFTYSFGDAGDPAGFWRREEQRGDPVLATLVTLLALDVHVDEAAAGEDPMAGTLYTWPRAFEQPTGVARAELEEAFGADRVAGWFTPDGDYLGWRVGIRGDGSWVFYVAGD